MTAELHVSTVNIVLLLFSSLLALAMVSSFRKDMLRSRSQKLFFSKIVIATFCMICCMAANFRGTETQDLLNVILISISHVGVYVVYYLYIEYLRTKTEALDPEHPVAGPVSTVSLIICIIGSALSVISTASGEKHIFSDSAYSMGVLFEIGHIGGFILILITFFILWRHNRTLGQRNSFILSAMPLLMLFATFVEPFLSGIELHYPLIVLEFCIVYTQHHLDTELRMKKDEVENTKARLALATGRMEPHYLYNVLTTIYYLCDTEPQKAQKAIGTFAEYMRSTLETLEKQELVSFAWELGEIRHYLELEKLRYGDRLSIEYDIETEDFRIPPLSVQPLVENAVRHGIAEKEEGGTVKIASEKLPDGGVRISVTDDGAGFDTGSLAAMDATHEGIANVRERLRLEVGGELTITSEPGKGTAAVVTIGAQDGSVH